MCAGDENVRISIFMCMRRRFRTQRRRTGNENFILLQLPSKRIYNVWRSWFIISVMLKNESFKANSNSRNVLNLLYKSTVLSNLLRWNSRKSLHIFSFSAVLTSFFSSVFSLLVWFPQLVELYFSEKSFFYFYVRFLKTDKKYDWETVDVKKCLATT